MNSTRTILKPSAPLLSACLLILAASACNPNQPAAESTPIVHTQQVTQVVKREITLEVTRVIEVPVTVTPSPTPEFTVTPSLTPTLPEPLPLTPTPTLPLATILVPTDCLYGPGELFLYKTFIFAGSMVEVVGRDASALWLNVQEPHGWNSCWMPLENAYLHAVSTTDLPVVTTQLPLTRYDYNPPAGYARREGDIVTVFWEAVWMAQDEVRGYLLEVKACQGGEFIQELIHVPVTYDENVGTLSYQVTDEAGCSEASGVRIASAGKRGYTLFERVIWPPR
jgi:hypothetical protein